MTEVAGQGVGRRARRSRWAIALCALLILASCGAGLFVWRGRHSYHLATVQEGVLYRDGSRSLRQFDGALRSVHPKTVVSLLDPAEASDPSRPQFTQEAQLCGARGARLERIQVKLGGWPDSEDIRRFLDIVRERGNQPVLVHCAQGVRRTAFFVAAYQESVLGYDKARAKAAILTFGHSEKTIDDIRRFIDGYDSESQTVRMTTNEE